jgi:hypothetical protein
MSGSETIYTARFIGPEIIEAGRANVISCTVYRDGAIVTPSAGAVTVYKADNGTVSAGAVSFAGGVASATISAPALSGLTPEDGWRVEWAMTIAAVVYTFANDAALVYRRLYPVITDADLLRAHTDLTRRMPTTETSYQDYLDEAWARIESRLVGTGKRPWLIMSPSALRDIHTFQSLALIFSDFATGGPGTAEWETMLHYEAKLERAWSLLTYPQRDPTNGQPANAPGTRQAGVPTTWAGSRRGSSNWGTT